ncbi:uncharacterized protein LOC124155029 [Ischnura elegans]|uniref:uncharacterized protein LOC124155029 n=1 Tax=Ischnura elegans TaxID=197161 RepID=UPI001ED8B858|nr:uncharacterized protein LOC124155029 [Ischnura elegans]
MKTCPSVFGLGGLVAAIILSTIPGVTHGRPSVITDRQPKFSFMVPMNSYVYPMFMPPLRIMAPRLVIHGGSGAGRHTLSTGISKVPDRDAPKESVSGNGKATENNGDSWTKVSQSDASLKSVAKLNLPVRTHPMKIYVYHPAQRVKISNYLSLDADEPSKEFSMGAGSRNEESSHTRVGDTEVSSALLKRSARKAEPKIVPPWRSGEDKPIPFFQGFTSTPMAPKPLNFSGKPESKGQNSTPEIDSDMYGRPVSKCDGACNSHLTAKKSASEIGTTSETLEGDEISSTSE